MDWLEVLLIAVWVALAGFLAGLRLAAESRRRSADGNSLALVTWTTARFGFRRRASSRNAPNPGPTTAS